MLLWGLVAAISLVALIVVGYRTLDKDREPQLPTSATNKPAASTSLPSPADAGSDSTHLSHSTPAPATLASAAPTRDGFRRALAAQRFAEAIDYGRQLAAAGVATAEDRAALGLAYYERKDCRNAMLWTDSAIDSARNAGQTLSDLTNETRLRCAIDVNDTAAIIAALEELIRSTGNPKYWTLLGRYLFVELRNPHDELMVYRVLYHTFAMTRVDDFADMAQLLMDDGLAGEAQRVLDAAIARKIIDRWAIGSHRRLPERVKRQAEADQRGLDQRASRAAESSSGQDDVRLGQIYYGFGNYSSAVDAIESGLEAGAVKTLDDACVYLGLAHVALKNTAAAGAAFAKLETIPKLNPRVLALWRLFTDTQL